MSYDIFILLAASLPAATALIFAAIGETFTEASGIYNIGLEGIMAISAGVSFVGAAFTGNPLLGLSAGMGSGVLIGILTSIFEVNLRADQIVFGLGIILLGEFLAPLIRGVVGTETNIVHVFPVINASSLIYPFNVILSQNILTFVAYPVAFVVWLLLFKTQLGLSTRAIGENPNVASSTGLSVVRFRWFASIVGCAIAAMGGSYIVLGLNGTYTGVETAGRGFIAIAMVRVGVFKPLYIIIACLVFGTVQAIGLGLQVVTSSVPHQMLQMIPYIAGIAALILSGRSRTLVGPASLGIPYEKEKR